MKGSFKSGYKEEKFGDLGFGTKITDANTRLIHPDGSFNVRRTGLTFLRSLNLFHTLIGMSWLKFSGLFLLAYIVINLFFAMLYYAIGVEQLQGVHGNTPAEKFWDAFFFSTQTFTTVGYGTISPASFAANMLASLESMLGWCAFALATGLLYGRFSRPMARMIFSEHAIIAPYRDMTAFEFRIANARTNQLIEVEVQVILTKIETLPDGQKIRKFYELKLERTKINFLSLSWTIVHPIEESSPIYQLTKEELKRSDTEFLVLIKAFDDTFSQTVHTRSSYRSHEIVWGARFQSMYDNQEKGITTLRLDQIDAFENVSIEKPLASKQA